jgi:hypothetical protein
MLSKRRNNNGSPSTIVRMMKMEWSDNVVEIKLFVPRGEI